MGQVWLAEHISLGFHAVVKSLHPSYAQIEYPQIKELLKRFYAEARLLVELDHSAIVRLYDFVIQEEVPYLIMEYVQGIPLDKYIAQKGPLSLEETLAILRPIWDALEYIHKKGVIHRDIKPANLMVLSQGGAKLIDFGIAKALNSDLHLTQIGTQIGTALYMAPEQIQGQPVSPATDLYGMGLVVYECLIGRYPWDWQGLVAPQLYQKLLTEPPPIPAWCPESWRAFFEKALAKDPQQRFHTAKDMQNSLENLTFSPQVSGARAAPSEYTLTQESIAAKETSYSTAPPANPTSSLPTASSTSPQDTAPSTLSSLLAIALVIALGAGAFAGWKYLRNKHLQAEKEALSAQIRQALEAELQAYAARQPGTFEWDPLPQKKYSPNGKLLLSCHHSYTTTSIESKTYEETCFTFRLDNLTSGKRKVIRYYEVRYQCMRSGKATISYTYNPSQNRLTLTEIALPPPTCTPRSRKLSQEKKGECQATYPEDLYQEGQEISSETHNYEENSPPRETEDYYAPD